MAASLVIQRRHGRLTWAKDFAEGRVTPLWPEPIAVIPLSDADVLRPGSELFREWAKANPDKAGGAPKPLAATAPGTSELDQPDDCDDRSEIHLTPACPGPLRLPDGRAVEIGEGLVVMSVIRFAQLIEASRFKGATDV